MSVHQLIYCEDCLDFGNDFEEISSVIKEMASSGVCGPSSSGLLLERREIFPSSASRLPITIMWGILSVSARRIFFAPSLADCASIVAGSFLLLVVVGRILRRGVSHHSSAESEPAREQARSESYLQNVR